MALTAQQEQQVVLVKMVHKAQAVLMVPVRYHVYFNPSALVVLVARLVTHYVKMVVLLQLIILEQS
jgi:hypothetical protein